MIKLLLIDSVIFAGEPFRWAPACDYAANTAGFAYDYARKAYRASELEDARHSAKLAMDAALDAQIAAGACKCDDAENDAYAAYSFAKKAFRAADLAELQSYARKAMNEAGWAESAARDCK